MRPWLILDLATAAVSNAAEFITPASEREAPSNYSKPKAIADWQAKAFQADLDKAALDLDLARITGIGLSSGEVHGTSLCRTEREEYDLLDTLAGRIQADQPMLVSYNGLGFDWPLMMRRARYLGVKFPAINCDRYKSPHCDLLAKLSLHDPSRRKALGWYVRRLGWTDLVKPLTGAEEAQVPVTGRWDDLRTSLAHDVEATYRLAQWLGELV